MNAGDGVAFVLLAVVVRLAMEVIEYLPCGGARVRARSTERRESRALRVARVVDQWAAHRLQLVRRDRRRLPLVAHSVVQLRLQHKENKIHLRRALLCRRTKTCTQSIIKTLAFTVIYEFSLIKRFLRI